jgi:hypothetical protein
MFGFERRELEGNPFRPGFPIRRRSNESGEPSVADSGRIVQSYPYRQPALRMLPDRSPANAAFVAWCLPVPHHLVSEKAAEITCRPALGSAVQKGGRWRVRCGSRSATPHLRRAAGHEFLQANAYNGPRYDRGRSVRRRGHNRADNMGVAEGQDARSRNYRQSIRFTPTEVKSFAVRWDGLNGPRGLKSFCTCDGRHRLFAASGVIKWVRGAIPDRKNPVLNLHTSSPASQRG